MPRGQEHKSKMEATSEGSGGAGTDTSSPQEVGILSIADDDASALLSKLISLGYLRSPENENVDSQPLPPLGEPDQYTEQTTRHAKERLAQRREDGYCDPTDPAECCVVLVRETSEEDGCITRDQLAVDLQTSLDCKFGGRASATDLAEHHCIDVGAAKIAISEAGAYLRVHDDVISASHLDRLLGTIAEMLNDAGHIPIADLAANVCNVPLDLCLDSVLSEDRLKQLASLRGGETTVRIANLHSTGGGGMATRRELVMSTYDDGRAKLMRERLVSGEEPVSLAPIIQELMWDDEAAHECVVNLCGNGMLKGTVKGTAASAAYVPHVYVQKQRQSVEEYFRSNGYVTKHFITSLGVAAGASKVSFVRECCGQSGDMDIVELPHSVINAKDIVTPLEGLIEEANSLRSFLDPRTALPEALLSNQDDIRELLEEIVPSMLPEDVGFSTGTVVICDGGALYCSTGMAKDMTKILMPLIETYSRQRAKEIDEARSAARRKRKKTLPVTGEEGEIITTGAKLKKSKKSVRQEDDDDLAAVDDSPGSVPLNEVVASLVKEYPGLIEIQENCMVPLVNDQALWDPEDGYDGAGPVFELCRKVFNPSKIAKKCARAVKLELDKIESTRQGMALGGRKAGALKAASIEESFEASFADACYLIQMLAKLPQLLEGSEIADEKSVGNLQRDFLLGCASDFARRLTIFALYKHQVDGEEIFIFEPSSTSTNFPPPDVDVRTYPRTLLSCTPKQDGNKRQPLATLREVLPGSVGIELARLWKCLPGDCTDDPQVRPGSMDEFVRHAEESCLIICGLPYKKINKKAEKKAMFERRKQLTAFLEASSEPIEILQCTTILLYQQIKNIAVAGDELLGTVLEMLCNEKKINDGVKQNLLQMRDQIVPVQEEVHVDRDLLLSVVKGYGLCRDITSYN